MKPTPLILAIETSGRTGSVAIALGEKMLGETNFSAPMRHSAEIFPAINELLVRFSRKPKDIEHIYISVGPGSFTGLRIAAALAKATNLANAAKIVAVDTLDVIAANATDYIKKESTKDLNTIAAILDAKRSQFFIAAYEYEQGHWKKTMPDCLMTAEEFVGKFSGKSKPVWLLGEGLVFYKDKFKAEGIRFLDEKYWNPRAGNVYNLGWEKALAGQFADPLTLQPTYLRKPDIKEKSGLSFR
ncbi:MAG: tRNA (adenosine(37)-N6)-threonylcarbamoyltransferase complex dimerization subunit type 1 TsaB [Phycisphaerae bacterium]|nr:tRNA (adenosine(37)-N6)-threonylcarbamoyltransferase complex dimerization subunit type 1 TsaB [Phycisphaerae bacterium]MDD5380822.1 tRNA (adenosine(37)-N6)-threonylcarbamoyltransferase complex dimerization subunit type 1 TsaB [Phycisphaerae bacterium]